MSILLFALKSEKNLRHFFPKFMLFLTFYLSLSLGFFSFFFCIYYGKAEFSRDKIKCQLLFSLPNRYTRKSCLREIVFFMEIRLEVLAVLEGILFFLSLKMASNFILGSKFFNYLY